MEKKESPTPEEILEDYWQGFRLSAGLPHEPMSEKAKEYLLMAMKESENQSIKGLIEEVEKEKSNLPSDDWTRATYVYNRVIELLKSKIK
jgi:peptidyl-tRNA hydrolase